MTGRRLTCLEMAGRDLYIDGQREDTSLIALLGSVLSQKGVTNLRICFSPTAAAPS